MMAESSWKRLVAFWWSFAIKGTAAWCVFRSKYGFWGMLENISVVFVFVSLFDLFLLKVGCLKPLCSAAFDHFDMWTIRSVVFMNSEFIKRQALWLFQRKDINLSSLDQLIKYKLRKKNRRINWRFEVNTEDVICELIVYWSVPS